MKVSDTLKLYAVRHRWAYEELVVDAKMTEANRLFSGPAAVAFSYLKSCLCVEGKSSRWEVVRALRKELRQRRIPVPELSDHSFSTVRQEKLRIMSSHPDSMEELLYEWKLSEAKLLCEKVGTMYCYLLSVYGESRAIAGMLRDCIYLQGERSKSLCLTRTE